MFPPDYMDIRRRGANNLNASGISSAESFLKRLRESSDKGTEESLATMFGLAPGGENKVDAEAYKKLKERLQAAKERESKELEKGSQSMEEEPGTFALMMETTLDFYFLTPVLFQRSDGTPMFEPRSRDRLRMNYLVKQAQIEREDYRPTLGFVPDISPPSAERVQRIAMETVNSLTGPDHVHSPPDASSTALTDQPQPEESICPTMVNVYKPRIPIGHKHIPRSKYTYDEAFRMCPVMTGEGFERGAASCHIMLPGIFVPLIVYGLPRICAGNLVYCVRRLYGLFGVCLPSGLNWGDLQLRMEGASTPMDPLDDVLPEDDGKVRLYLCMLVSLWRIMIVVFVLFLFAPFFFLPFPYLDLLISPSLPPSLPPRITSPPLPFSSLIITPLPQNDSAISIDVPNGAVPVLHLESREVAISCIVRNAPKPYLIRGAPDLAELYKEQEVQKKKAADAAAAKAKNAASSKTGSSTSSSSSSSSSEEKSSSTTKATVEDEAEEKDEDADVERLYEAMARNKKPANADWKEQLTKYEPVSYTAKVKLDHFKRGFTVGDLKIAIAASANLELTQEQALALPLWRRVPDPEPFVKVGYINDEGEVDYEEVPLADAKEATAEGAIIEEVDEKHSPEEEEAIKTSIVHRHLAGLITSNSQPIHLEPTGAVGDKGMVTIKKKPTMTPVALLARRAPQAPIPAAEAKKYIASVTRETDTNLPFVSTSTSTTGAAAADADGSSSFKPSLSSSSGAFNREPGMSTVRREQHRAKDGVRYKWEPVPFSNSTKLWALDLDSCKHGYSVDGSALTDSGSVRSNNNVFELHYNVENVAEGELSKPALPKDAPSFAAIGMLDPKARKRKIIETIKTKQRIKLQQVSFERAKAAGILDEYLKKEAAKPKASGNDYGLFSNRNLIIFIIVYILAVSGFLLLRASNERTRANQIVQDAINTGKILTAMGAGSGEGSSGAGGGSGVAAAASAAAERLAAQAAAGEPVKPMTKALLDEILSKATAYSGKKK